MDNIIQLSDFTGRYALSVSEYAEDTFESYITDLQYDLLIDMLGAELYNDFDTNPTEQKWVDLLNGITYQDCYGFTRNWRGLKDLMQPYVYAKFTLDNFYKQVQSGTVKPKFENADILNERERKEVAYRSWNNFIKKWHECYIFLWTNCSDYTEFEFHFRQKKNRSLVSLGGIK